MEQYDYIVKDLLNDPQGRGLVEKFANHGPSMTPEKRKDYKASNQYIAARFVPQGMAEEEADSIARMITIHVAKQVIAQRAAAAEAAAPAAAPAAEEQGGGGRKRRTKRHKKRNRRYTKRQGRRTINNMGRGRRWDNTKRYIRNFQPHWFRKRKLRQRMNAARRAELKRDSVVARDLRNYHEREGATQEGPRVGQKFSTLRPPPPPPQPRPAPPPQTLLSRTGSRFRNTVGPYVVGAVEDQLMHELSGLSLPLLREQRLVERKGFAQHVVDTAVNHLVSGATGLPLLDPYDDLDPSPHMDSSQGRGVGASVMRKKIESQREDRELLSKFLHDELKRLEMKRLHQTQMRSDIETRRKKDKTRKRKKKGKKKKQPKLERARSGEM